MWAKLSDGGGAIGAFAFELAGRPVLVAGSAVAAIERWPVPLAAAPGAPGWLLGVAETATGAVTVIDPGRLLAPGAAAPPASHLVVLRAGWALAVCGLEVVAAGALEAGCGRGGEGLVIDGRRHAWLDLAALAARAGDRPPPGGEERDREQD